jgi:hypothetical protein
MPTSRVLGKTYCPQCGWNREEAEKQTRLLLRLLPVLVIVFDAPLIVWVLVGHAELPELAALGLLSIVPAILVVLVARGKVRFEALAERGSTSAQSTAAGTGATTTPNEPMAQQYATLAELQRPRLVRMSRLGKMNTAIIFISLLVFAGVLAAIVAIRPASGGNPALPRPVVYLLPLGLLAVIALFTRRSLAQQRRLLAMGELAMARVTKQWTARNGNGIRYEFTTQTGEILSGMTTDNSRQLLVGMSLPVFYDPQQPKKQVAPCAAFYEVVLPGQK